LNQLIKLEVISMNLCKSLVLVIGIALSINSVGAMPVNPADYTHQPDGTWTYNHGPHNGQHVHSPAILNQLNQQVAVAHVAPAVAPAVAVAPAQAVQAPAQESRLCTLIKNHPWYSLGIAYGLFLINKKALDCVIDVNYCNGMQPYLPPIVIFGATAALCYKPVKQFCYEPAKKVLTSLYRWAKTKLSRQ
jgi:hypothetical protein